jgi:hypothetical protein
MKVYIFRERAQLMFNSMTIIQLGEVFVFTGGPQDARSSTNAVALGATFVWHGLR